MDKSNQLRVKSFEPTLVQIEIVDFNSWKQENTGSEIKIGSYLKIEDGDNNCILALVKSFRMIESEESGASVQNNYEGSFLVNTQPIGQLCYEDGKPIFRKGIRDICIPPTGVSLATIQDLKKVFSVDCESSICFSSHLLNENIDIILDGDKFFSKHIAVVGSTGSGKSCTVSKIIQTAKESVSDTLNNTHIIIFDIHGEYHRAFPDANLLSIENNSFYLPYWLMNSEELEDMFIESQEANSHNQVSQFKQAIINNKKKYNPTTQITYDAPVFFSINEVYNYIDNRNKETYFEKDGKYLFAKIGAEDENTKYDMLWSKYDFIESTGNTKHKMLDAKVRKGDFNGEFNRFVSRLETKLNDERLNFLLSEKDANNKKYETTDLNNIYKNILGYTEKNSNITIIDLSSLPFEIVSIIVSMISRLVFDFSYYTLKTHGENKTPYMLVYEEAHKYVPKANDSRYKNTRIAVERVAKEGRKYGLSSMIVSQRPSEISSTVFSQCNNFVVMRLTNPEDQSYVKRLLPEAVVSYGDALSSLEQREALLVGDSITTPSIVNIKETSPTPKSDDIKFYTEWSKNWININFGDIINQINKNKIEDSCK